MSNHRFPVEGAEFGSFPSFSLSDFSCGSAFLGWITGRNKDQIPNLLKVMKNLIKISVTTFDNLLLKPSEQVLWEELNFPPTSQEEEPKEPKVKEF